MKSPTPSKHSRLNWLNKFYGGFSDITVLNALDILCTALKCDQTRFRTNGVEHFITDLYCNETVFQLPAQCLMLEWYGGPPKRGQWFKASMLALVVDHCLLAMEFGQSERVCNALGMAANYGNQKETATSVGP